MNTGAIVRGLRSWRHGFTAAACVLLVAAVVLPRVTLPRDTYSYVVTFDITQSMDVEDESLNGEPVSRLAFARAAMRDALAQLPCGSKIGWSVFTGERTLLLLGPIEVCSHYDALLASLDAIDGRMRWTNWSRIAEGGVYSAVRVAREIGRGVAVIFVTDGQEAPPVLPSDALVRDINPEQVGGWLIGVGGDQPAPIPKTDANGERIGYWQANDVIQVPTPQGAASPDSHEERSALRGQYLAAVAGRIGFGYRRLLTPVSLSDAMRDARLVHREPVATDVRAYPALLALLLLVVRFMPESGWFRWMRRDAGG
ncbi:MxaL protein [Paraburkholderia sp.]|uniref:MxaL protein n=1 Tax=Paraburkholderia sp. TaxID=1926495 RepID=UPI003D701745